MTAVRRAVDAILALSTAQLPRVEEMAAEGTAYLERIDLLVARLAGPALPPGPTSTAPLTVLVGPERPWCGALTRRVLDELPAAGPLGLVGAELRARATGLGERLRFSLPGAADPEELPAVTRAVARGILDEAAGRHVVLVYPVGARARIARATLLAGARTPAERPLETLSPIDDVLRAAVSEAAVGRVEVALAEALRAEVASRVARARSASQACRRRSEELSFVLRVLRQEEITREVCELAAATLR